MSVNSASRSLSLPSAQLTPSNVGHLLESLALSLAHVPGYDVIGTVDGFRKAVRGVASGDHVVVMLDPIGPRA